MFDEHIFSELSTIKISQHLLIIWFLPDEVCRLRPSESSLGSSSLQSAHTLVYSPAMSPLTAEIADRTEKKERFIRIRTQNWVSE